MSKEYETMRDAEFMSVNFCPVCPEWDDMKIHKYNDEFKNCSCFFNNIYADEWKRFHSEKYWTIINIRDNN